MLMIANVLGVITCNLCCVPFKVRRDNSPLVSSLISMCLQKLLIDRYVGYFCVVIFYLTKYLSTLFL